MELSGRSGVLCPAGRDPPGPCRRRFGKVVLFSLYGGVCGFPWPGSTSDGDERLCVLKREIVGALAALWITSGVATAQAGAGSRPLLDESLHHEGCDLALRSSSLKEATFLNVNVYWVGLYLEAAGTPADSIIKSSQVKAFVFHFLRDVKSTKLGEAWIKDLTASCETGCDSVIAQGKVLAGSMPDVRSSQKIAYVVFADQVDVLIDGVTLGSLLGTDAARAILATFLGPRAPSRMRKDLFSKQVLSAGQ